MHKQKSLDNDLFIVQKKVIIMAEMALQELNDSLTSFIERDQKMASDIVESDCLINASERIIDNMVVDKIVSHQPSATDCKKLVSVLRISKDLERIGDYAKNIAKHSTTLDKLQLTGEESSVKDMGNAVCFMLESVIEAYSNLNAELAETARQQDQAIDTLYTHIFSQLLTINKNNPEIADSCTHLLFIARSLERIGDHITDIAEEVLYISTGQFVDDDRAKADSSAFITSS